MHRCFDYKHWTAIHRPKHMFVASLQVRQVSILNCLSVRFTSAHSFARWERRNNIIACYSNENVEVVERVTSQSIVLSILTTARENDGFSCESSVGFKQYGP